MTDFGERPADPGRRLAPGTNALVVAPDAVSSDVSSRPETLSAVELGDANVVSVGFGESVAAWCRRWRDSVNCRVENHHHVVLAAVAYSGSDLADLTPIARGETDVSWVDPKELTELGIVLSEQFEEWAGDDSPTVVCFEPLSALLQYAELKRLFRFLHVIVRRAQTLDATAYYHVNVDAHDAQTVNVFKQLMDAVVEYDDSEWTVR